jgi:Cdc6-like AAA superfamily ATPase
MCIDTQLWRGVSGYTNSSKSAMASLYRYFEDKQTVATYTVPTDDAEGERANDADGNQKAKKKRLLSVTGKEVIVCVLDELEYLFTRDSRIIFNIFDFTLRRHSAHPLVLIAIGNTMDLVEKISAR